MILGVRHTGIVVRDLKKTGDFYRALGFVDNISDLEKGDFIDQVTGLDNTELEWVKLKSPDGFTLELLKYHSHPEEKAIINQNSNRLGCSHIAFTVRDIEKTCGLIKEMGGSVVNAPALTSNKKLRVAYCHDVEGVLMEIVEILENV